MEWIRRSSLPFLAASSNTSRQSPPFNRLYGEIYPFLAWRDGKPVGRIAAIINRAHNERYGDKTGFFGFFDCEDNIELARALFDAAGEVLRSRGMESIRGPYNPSINDECGLLVEGFEHPPCLGLCWNPEYHKTLIEQLGFRPVCRSFGFLLPLHRLKLRSVLSESSNAIAKRTEYQAAADQDVPA